MHTDIGSTIKQCRERVSDLLAEERIERQNLEKDEKKLPAIQADLDELRVMQDVLQTSVKLMFENLSVKLGNVLTEGLMLVFPESDLSFKVEFVERRNQIEADIYLEDSEGVQYDPINSVGGGITDFLSLLLRVVYIKLSKYRNFIAADEPSKFISRDKLYEATVFLSKVCTDLKFDLLAVTHIPEMVDASTTVYHVTRKKGRSIVSHGKTKILSSKESVKEVHGNP